MRRRDEHGKNAIRESFFLHMSSLASCDRPRGFKRESKDTRYGKELLKNSVTLRVCDDAAAGGKC